jgi:type IV pilus assembly protein PilC
MLFDYRVLTPTGGNDAGQIEAVSQDAAIGSLQKRGFIVVSVTLNKGGKGFNKRIALFEHVPLRALVVTSRQLATLFDAQVSALKAFSLLSQTASHPMLQTALASVAQDIQGGITISGAMEKHPAVFSNFYANMVRAGEESGKLTDTFRYLADYLERQYELTSKTRNALIYPAFVIFTFIAVLILMLTMVIPRLSQILIETGQKLPVYTRIVIAFSDFFVQYGLILVLVVAVLGLWFWRASKTVRGKRRIDGWKLSLPVIGQLSQKLYLSRMADNLDTMLSAGIPIVRALEITGDVVGSSIYRDIMKQSVQDVQAGKTLSSSLESHQEIPPIMVAMVRVGEETGSLGSILKTLARFYKREVDGAVDTLIGLIEPIMIVGLGIGVGFLLSAILIPIYNIASSL